jgi:hypothetical protein
VKKANPKPSFPAFVTLPQFMGQCQLFHASSVVRKMSIRAKAGFGIPKPQLFRSFAGL